MTNEEYTEIVDDLYRAWKTAYLSEAVVDDTEQDEGNKLFYKGQQAGFAWAACYMQQYANISEDEYLTPFRMEMKFRERYEHE